MLRSLSDYRMIRFSKLWSNRNSMEAERTAFEYIIILLILVTSVKNNESPGLLINVDAYCTPIPGAQ